MPSLRHAATVLVALLTVLSATATAALASADRRPKDVGQSLAVPAYFSRSENLSDSLSLFLLHRPVPAVARWSYLVSTGVLRLLRGELPDDVELS